MNERVVNFFVGEGDFTSQKRLSHARRLAGWYMGASTESAHIREGMNYVADAIVTINGADAGECVPLLAAEALARGARRVEIPLDKIKTAFEGDDVLLTRVRELANKLDISTALNDPRLNVTPQSVWDQAKKWRMIGSTPRYFRDLGTGE